MWYKEKRNLKLQLDSKLWPIFFFWCGRSYPWEYLNEKYDLASLVLCWAKAGHSIEESLLHPRCSEAVECGSVWPRRIIWLLELPFFWLCGDQGKPFQFVWRARSRVSRASWGALWLKSQELCNLSLFPQFFSLKITCLNWAMQLCVGGVLTLGALRSECASQWYFISSSHPHPKKL